MGVQRTHHSVPYSVPLRAKPALVQYTAQNKGVMAENEIDAPVRARPELASGRREEVTTLYPGGSVTVVEVVRERALLVREARAVLSRRKIRGRRQSTSRQVERFLLFGLEILLNSQTMDRAEFPPQVCVESPPHAIGKALERRESEARFDKRFPQ